MIRLFSRLYGRVMGWSRHPHATRYLAVLSFAESSFFPVPRDVMLARMAMAEPRRAWHGERMEGLLRRYIDALGWLTVLVALVVFVLVQE